jgi:lambda family phage portal protein
MASLPPQIEATLSGQAGLSVASQLYPNLESYPGQLLVTPPKLSARQESVMSRDAAVRAARQVERTSALIASGIDRNADMVVGGRLMPQPNPDWESLGIDDADARRTFQRSCQRAFVHWGYDSRNLCDAEGDDNFGGLIWRAYRNTRDANGETAGIIHFEPERRAEYATAWGTFVTVLDPDRVGTPPEKTGDRSVIEGRQVDRHGRMLGFHCRTAHPSEGWTGESAEYEFVPRETWWGRPMGWHWFQKTRGGQPRGMTPLVTIIRQVLKVTTLDDHHIGAAAIAAMLAAFIKTTASPETVGEMLSPRAGGQSEIDAKFDHYQKVKVKIGQQVLPVLAPNDEVVFAAVQRSIADPTAFRNNFLREFSLSLGLSFEQLSNNVSDANYSGMRAALLEVWRGVVSQRFRFGNAVPTPIYSAVIEEAVAIGRVIIPAGWPPFQENRTAYVGVNWTGPGMGWIDPLKEANAMLVRLNARIRSRSQEAAANGDDYLAIFDQIEQEQIEAAERGFSLDVKTTADAPQGDEGDDGGDSPKRKSTNGNQGDGDGDGVANEEEL